MGPTADKFHFLLWRKLTEISKNQNYDMKMDTLFEEIKEKKDFLTTDVTILNKIDRNLTIGEFFGDSRVDNHEIETYGNITLDFDEEAANNSFDFNPSLNSYPLPATCSKLQSGLTKNTCAKPFCNGKF